MDVNKDLLLNRTKERRVGRKCRVVDCQNTNKKNSKLQFYRYPARSYEL